MNESLWIYPILVDTSESPRYMGNRRCSNVKETKKNLRPRIQEGSCGIVAEKGYSMAEASRNLGIEDSSCQLEKTAGR